MKPEPLKNKWKTKIRANSREKYQKIFNELDIKSAVEWLNREDIKVLLQFKEKQFDELTLVEKLSQNKVKAFEDVIEKMNQKELIKEAEELLEDSKEFRESIRKLILN